jgi:predicted ABC-type ATPase
VNTARIMKTEKTTPYPFAHQAEETFISAERIALIDAILSDIGVPESFVSASAPEGIVRETPIEPGGVSPVCHIVAGANGSGKSTFSLCFLPRYAACLEFVNPDLIAAGLSPLAPTHAALRAGKLVLERIAALSAGHRDFGFETTLSGRGYLSVVKALRASGYRLHLYYLWTPGCDLLLSRIRQRVAAGGHTVPDQDVRRRRERSVENLKGYAEVMDKVRVFDNSEASPVLVYEKNGAALVYDEERFARIQKELGL